MVTINEWTDRIYQHTPQEHIITNVVSGRKMKLQKYNFPDTGTHMCTIYNYISTMTTVFKISKNLKLKLKRKENQSKIAAYNCNGQI